MFQRLQKKRQGEGGFTLIELLVVILINPILAAIAIPVFLRQREKGWVSQSSSALKNGATAIESAAVPEGGDYSVALGADPEAVMLAEGWKHAGAVTFVSAASTATTYCLQVTHSSLGGHAWENAHYDSDDGEPLPGAC